MGFNDDLFVCQISIWQIGGDEYERQVRPYDEEAPRVSVVAPTQQAKLDTTHVLLARAREEPVSMSMYKVVFTPYREPMPYDLFMWLYS